MASGAGSSSARPKPKLISLTSYDGKRFTLHESAAFLSPYIKRIQEEAPRRTIVLDKANQKFLQVICDYLVHLEDAGDDKEKKNKICETELGIGWMEDSFLDGLLSLAVELELEHLENHIETTLINRDIARGVY
ncbi:hypothetical protein CASFOL_017373 [Castilleja foliolosa]|uniref:SKP1 component POZ domain-containing protein n=1 Tax=Castilleja foliolosa TaxID=1961234 RepID=A0ABD3DD07_9LAMI